MNALKTVRGILGGLSGLVLAAGLAFLPTASAVANPDAAKPAAEKPKDAETGAKRKLDGKVRVAILPYGVPRADNNYKNGNTVGQEIVAKHWKEVIPMLEADKVDVVVVHVNSGGGLGLEVGNFIDVFTKEFQPRFKTVAWIEWAISAAAMSPWILEELYFKPDGVIGGATGHYGGRVAVSGFVALKTDDQMERVARLANRSSLIMQSMMYMKPLSANIDENGEVTFFQDLTGRHIINPAQRVLTMNSADAMKFRVGAGQASTVPELMSAMGIKEYEVVGKKATDYLMAKMKEQHVAGEKFQEVFVKYQMAVQAASQMQDRQTRGSEVGVARRHLNNLRGWVRSNPNLGLLNGASPEWFRNQDDMLQELMRR